MDNDSPGEGMSWIKMRTNLTTHPKVVAMSLALKQPRYAVVGALHGVWSIADQHTEDGRLGMTPEVLDAVVGCPGISEAMLNVEWLCKDAANLAVPAFDTHNSRSAKSRASEAVRSANRRGNVSRPGGDQLFPVENRSGTGPREEKRREEEEKDRGSVRSEEGQLPTVLRTPEFTAAWNRWIKDRKDRRKPVTDNAAALQLSQLADLASKRGVHYAIAAIDVCIERAWQGIKYGIDEVLKNPPKGQAPSTTTKAAPTPWTKFDALPLAKQTVILQAIAAKLRAGSRVQKVAAEIPDAERRTSPFWTDELVIAMRGGGTAT